jgi:glycosyltransferase involved in cell wall biosynthesis
VPSRRWLLTCAGSLDRDPATVATVRALIERLRLSGSVTLAGELDAEPLAALYERSDAFALATLRETFGMAVAEAIARGLPVVATSVGAIPRIVGDGGFLVPPDDERALTAALTRLIDDRERRGALAEGARAARNRLRTWEDASAAMAAALSRVSADD